MEYLGSIFTKKKNKISKKQKEKEEKREQIDILFDCSSYRPLERNGIKKNPGLVNFGNSCFINAVLQSFSSCTYLIEFLIQKNYQFKLMNLESKYERLFKFSEVLLKFLLAINLNE